MGRLLLVRHGESVWNRDGIVQGQAGPGLSRLGTDQAKLLGEWLAEEAPSAAFVSSDLDRCTETAAPYARLVGRDPVLDETLRERHFGDWQGAPRAELQHRDPARWARFAAREDVVAEVGGESTRALVERVVPALHRLAAAAPTTVVVTHGGPIWHGTQAMLGIREGVLGPVGNASVTAIDVDGGSVRLLGWNALGHISPELRTTWRRPVHDPEPPVDEGAAGTT